MIDGGGPGRDRLRILAQVMWPSTRALLVPLVRPDAHCLDAGCGGGDVTLDSRLVPEGSVVGTDFDTIKLELARAEAAGAGIENVEFRGEDVLTRNGDASAFDVVYTRFPALPPSGPGAAWSRTSPPGSRRAA